MGAKVAVFVFNHLRNDARVHRQAESLARAGHEVRIFAFFDPACPEVEEHPAGYTILRTDQRSPIDRWWSRTWQRSRSTPPLFSPDLSPLELPGRRPAQRPCPRPSVATLPLTSSPQRRSHRGYIAHINQIWWKAARAWKPDLCQAHDLDALWAAQATAYSCGAALLYDSHEIWSEQHFIQDQEEKRFWEQWEARLAPSVDGWMTVNGSLANLLGQRYGVEVATVMNCPALTTLEAGRRGSLKDRFEGRPVAIFSGGFQAGRGLEQMIAAALLQQEVALVLQGFGAQEPSLRRLAEEHRSPVAFLPEVDFRQLTLVCSQADLGLMPVLPNCLNSFYCSPNKVFDYMMAGLAILASDLPEMFHLVSRCGNGRLYDPYSPNDLAQSLVDLAKDPALPSMAQASRDWAERHYHWGAQQSRLLALVEELLQRRRQGGLRVKNWVDPQSHGLAQRAAAIPAH